MGKELSRLACSVTSGKSWPLERRLLRRLLESVGEPPIRVLLWDRFAIGKGADESGLSIFIRNRKTLWRLLRAPAFHFSEAYAEGSLEIEGDLVEVMGRLNRALKEAEQGKKRRFAHRWGGAGEKTLRGSLRNVQHHYDLGNDFYRLWLDEKLLYTCAYYESEEASLEAAQVAKMDHICRKLRLKPGEQVIEAGCGWGGFALHMARHYGVSVRAYNISKEQLAYARQQAREEGLADRVEFLERDWRKITGECDAFVSVGMLEHVGPANFPRFGEVVRSVLRPQGRGLIHTIGRNHDCRLNRWIERRIFPGAQPPTLKQMMGIFEPIDFSVNDVENIRLHYARTCRHWLERFEESCDDVREMFDEKFVRMWRMYLAASASAFETGWLQLFQVLFTPARNNSVPATRSYMYPES